MADQGDRIAAGNPLFEKRVQSLADQVHARFRYHSIELPDGSILPGLQTVEHLRWRLGLFGLPLDLSGKRVLDIGAWDGWFSFECERRGAQVIAVDCVELDTFLEARRLLKSSVEYLTLDVNELSVARLGHFDIVLFFGVLYHLRHPLAGLEKCVELSTDTVLVESFVIEPESRAVPAVMEYYERTELGGQLDNWCGPSPDCLTSFCRSAGFAQVDLIDVTNSRASVLCRRRWPEPAHAPSAAAPHLVSAVNNRTWQAVFHPLKDEYLCCFFRSEERNLTPDSVFVEVDGWGTQALVVVSDGTETNGVTGWQANCLRPPGLSPGRHSVRLRTAESSLSNSVECTMLDHQGRDPLQAGPLSTGAPPEICSAEYKASGDLRYAGSRHGYLVSYFRLPVDSIRASDVELSLSERSGSRIVPAQTVSSLGNGLWQSNSLLNEPAPAGTRVKIRLRNGQWSLESEIQVQM